MLDICVVLPLRPKQNSIVNLHLPGEKQQYIQMLQNSYKSPRLSGLCGKDKNHMRIQLPFLGLTPLDWESRLPGGVSILPRIHIPPAHTRAKLQYPKIPLALGGGMWHTISVLPLNGEITDYPRGWVACVAIIASRRYWKKR